MKTRPVGSVYLVNDGVSVAELCGVVAAAVLADLTENSFTFCGFPEVRLEMDDKLNLFISLAVHGQESAQVAFSVKELKKHLAIVHDRKPVPLALVLKVQKMVAELEQLVEAVKHD